MKVLDKDVKNIKLGNTQVQKVINWIDKTVINQYRTPYQLLSDNTGDPLTSPVAFTVNFSKVASVDRENFSITYSELIVSWDCTGMYPELTFTNGNYYFIVDFLVGNKSFVLSDIGVVNESLGRIFFTHKFTNLTVTYTESEWILFVNYTRMGHISFEYKDETLPPPTEPVKTFHTEDVFFLQDGLPYGFPPIVAILTPKNINVDTKTVEFRIDLDGYWHEWIEAPMFKVFVNKGDGYVESSWFLMTIDVNITDERGWYKCSGSLHSLTVTFTSIEWDKLYRVGDVSTYTN